MKKKVVHLGWIIAIVLIGLFTQARRENNESSTDDLTQLKALNARFIHNFVTNDTASHSKIIHRDFILITPSGGKVNRKDYLEEWAHGFDPKKHYYWDYRDQNISVFGSCALVRSVTKHTKLVDGKEIPVMTRYTDTYVKEKGKWQCVQAQLTSVTPENFPGDETIVKKYLNGVLQTGL